MAKMAKSPDGAVLTAARAALADCPLDVEELVALLAAQGLELGPEPEERLVEVLDPDRFVELADGRLTDVVSVAEGIVLTHELTWEEVERAAVAVHPDFSVLEDLELAGIEVTLEHVHAEDEDDVCRLHGPPGWLGSAPAPGQVLTLTVHHGRIEVAFEPDPRAADPRAVEALRAAFEELNDEEDDPEPVESFSVWLEAAAADPDTFRRAQAPMGQLLAAAGCETRDEMVATAGFDWDEWEFQAVIRQVARRWDLDEMGEMAWTMLADAYERLADGAEIDPEIDPEIDRATILAGLAAMLSYENVGPAFVGEIMNDRSDADGTVADFARRLRDGGRGKTRAGPLWLLSICAERDGRTLEAEELLTKARLADATFVPALEDAAWYAADRGDARRAASLLRQAGEEPDAGLLATYDRFAKSPHAEVGRNEPCPCGSGRKYKHCHLGRVALPLSQRCVFLYQKAVSYLQRGRHMRQIFDIAAALAGVDPDPSELLRALEDPITIDLALFEGGLWNDFLRDRAMLLPADELLLAQQWQLIDRSLHEIVSVHPGLSVEARDIRTGDVVDVAETTASRQLMASELVLARIVPDGEGYQFFGGIEPMSLRLRDPLLALLDSEPSGVEVAEWLAAAKAPPRLVNYEHEPTMLCTLTYTVDDPDAVAATLDQILEPANPGEWVETVETEQMGRTIRGFVRLDGTTLTAEANSEVRADRFKSLLESSLAGWHPVADVRTSPADAMADAAAAGEVHEPMEITAEMAEALDQFMADYERRWVDTNIPALAGLTPRQAADDPTRREDLLALLDEFERQDPPEGREPIMNVRRIRTLLGLEA